MNSDFTATAGSLDTKESIRYSTQESPKYNCRFFADLQHDFKHSP